MNKNPGQSTCAALESIELLVNVLLIADHETSTQRITQRRPRGAKLSTSGATVRWTSHPVEPKGEGGDDDDEDSCEISRARLAARGREIEGLSAIQKGEKSHFSDQDRPSRTNPRSSTSDKFCGAMIMRSCKGAGSRAMKTALGGLCRRGRKEEDSGRSREA